MSKMKVLELDADLKVSEDGSKVTITIEANEGIFHDKDSAQIILDATSDMAMEYYSMTPDDWDRLGKEGLDS